MSKPTVLHALYSYLPVTQNWIYAQLRFNDFCNHSVISITEENASQFPLQNRYTAFARNSLMDRIQLLLAWYWVRQPEAFFASVLTTVSPDIVHGHFAPEAWRLLPLVRKTGIPMVTTFYGLDVDKLPRRRFWKQRYPQIFDYSSFVLVEGPFMGKRLEAIGCPAEKIEVVSLGVDRTRYTTASLQRTRNSDEPVHVLFVGLNREKKGSRDAATIFAEAAKQDNRLELHVVGTGHYRTAVERILKKEGVFERAVFHGELSFERYCRVLAESDILLAPSCYASDGDCEGGAPVVCIEAQVAGLPVIGTKHCDIPHVVHHKESGLLSQEHDIASMVYDLLYLASDKDARRKMGEYGKEHTERHHDIHRQVERISEVYRLAVERRKVDGSTV